MLNRLLLLIVGFIISFSQCFGAYAPKTKKDPKVFRLLPAALENQPVFDLEINKKINITIEPPVSCSLNFNLNEIPENKRKDFEIAIEKIGCNHIKSLKTLEIFTDENLPRALAGNNILKIRSDVFAKEEFESLIIHELSHVVDLGYYRGKPKSGESAFQDGSLPIFNDDLSVEFYSISWENSTVKKVEAESLDFVTGYAMTDPFEDFAESMTMYIEHNQDFKKMADKNLSLSKKYDFIKNKVFEGKMFASKNRNIDLNTREWDATKVSF